MSPSTWLCTCWGRRGVGERQGARRASGEEEGAENGHLEGRPRKGVVHSSPPRPATQLCRCWSHPGSPFLSAGCLVGAPL